jgi:hypothetical protein
MGVSCPPRRLQPHTTPRDIGRTGDLGALCSPSYWVGVPDLGHPDEPARECRDRHRKEIEMIVVRTVLEARFGTGGKLAASFTEASRSMMTELGTRRRWRVLTDLSGTFDTVIQEIEAESLAEWETLRTRLFELAAFQASMATMQELVVSGRNELWTVEAEG